MKGLEGTLGSEVKEVDTLSRSESQSHNRSGVNLVKAGCFISQIQGRAQESAEGVAQQINRAPFPTCLSQVYTRFRVENHSTNSMY